MTLEQCMTRAGELEVAIINTTAQLNALHGHKAETMYWINTLKEAAANASETQVEYNDAAVLD